MLPYTLFLPQFTHATTSLTCTKEIHSSPRQGAFPLLQLFLFFLFFFLFFMWTWWTSSFHFPFCLFSQAVLDSSYGPRNIYTKVCSSIHVNARDSYIYMYYYYYYIILSSILFLYTCVVPNSIKRVRYIYIHLSLLLFCTLNSISRLHKFIFL